jgi:hypothetical protein
MLKDELDELISSLDYEKEKMVDMFDVLRSISNKIKSKFLKSERQEEKRCYSEEGELPLRDDIDHEAAFDRARAIGRIEGLFLKVVGDPIFSYTEDEISEISHEELFEKLHFLYEGLMQILNEFERL